MEDLISVVVPIYNVEKYLKTCIETIIKQTYKNIEIILVNDGSTDNSLQICNEFKEKEKRIKVINKKNGGLSDARNIGLKKAKGKYICFIDSDDFINEKYIEELHSLIIKNNAQIAICSFENVNEFGESIYKKEIISQVVSRKEMLEQMNNKSFYPASIVAWNKLYDINLFKNIIYPEGKIHEDEFTTYKLYYLSEKVVTTSECLYYYRMVPTSIMNKKFNIKRLDVLEALEERMNFFLEKKEQGLYDLALIQYEKVLIGNYVNCRRYLENSNEKQIELLEIFRKYYSEVMKVGKCAIVDKFRFRIAYISPTIYYYMILFIYKIRKVLC